MPLTQRPLQPDESLYFLHIDKTAGSSVTALLDDRFHADAICPAQTWDPLLEIPAEKWADYRLFRGHFCCALPALLPRPPVLLTMLRDPIERALSHFGQVSREERWFQAIAQEKGLIGFLKHPEAGLLLTNWQTRNLVFDADIRSIAATCSLPLVRDCVDRTPLDIPERDMLDIAIQRLETFAFAGTTERLDESLALLTHTLAWPSVTTIPQINVAQKRLNRQEIASDVLDALTEHNQLDRQLYEYVQKRLEERVAKLRALPDKPVQSLPTELATNHIEYDFAQPLCGFGWQNREYDSARGLHFRWTGPQTRATLQFPLTADEPLAVRFCVLTALAPDIFQQLRLEVNGDPIPLRKQTGPSGEPLFAGVIPLATLAKSRGRNTELAFCTNRVVSPVSLGLNDDAREVGLAFAWVRVSPAKAEASGFGGFFRSLFGGGRR